MHRSVRDGVAHLSYADPRLSDVCRRASYGCRDRSYAVKLPGKDVFS